MANNPTMLDDLKRDVQRYNINVEFYCDGITADQDVFWDNDSDPYLDGTFGEINAIILAELEAQE